MASENFSLVFIDKDTALEAFIARLLSTKWIS